MVNLYYKICFSEIQKKKKNEQNRVITAIFCDTFKEFIYKKLSLSINKLLKDLIVHNKRNTNLII